MTEKPRKYVHSGRIDEVKRLEAQAVALKGITERELQIIGFKPGMTVLDAGCGTGAVSRMMAQMVSPGLVHGIDIDPVFITEAKKFAAKQRIPNIKFDLGDVNKLQFRNDTFDVIYCRLVLMHVDDPIKAICELKRVTKKGGIVAISENDDGGLITYPEMPQALDIWGKFGRLAKSRGEDRLLGRKLFSMMTNAGLSSIRIYPFPIYATQQNPAFLKMLLSVPLQIIESEKEELLSGKIITADEYQIGMKEIEKLSAHPGAFVLNNSFLAVGQVPP